MRERAEIVGGTFRVDSVPGRGTRVVAELPVPDDGEVVEPGTDGLAQQATTSEGGELT